MTNPATRFHCRRGVRLLCASTLLLAMTAASANSEWKLTGAQEVPPVTTAASGSCEISIGTDGLISGIVETAGIDGTMAHIHIGSVGSNGPVVVTLIKSPTGKWSVPEGAKLTPAQLEAYKAGKLYVNVHSESHPAGEIRVQLLPR